MGYIVIANFTDSEDKGRLYEIDQPYPSEGYEPSKERVEALSSKNNKANKVLLQEVEDEPKNEDPEGGNSDGAPDEFPKNTGGSWYELSNGEKIQGKDEAIEAENALKSGE